MFKKVFYGWWIVLACFFITFFVGGIVFSGFTAFFGPIREEFGWSYTQVSLGVSLRGFEMGIFAPLVGFLVDRYGSRQLVIYGIVTVGLGLVCLSFTRSLAMFYGSFLVIAFGASGCAAVVITTAVASWFHKKVGIALGIMGSGVGIGGFMIPIIVLLIDKYQWRTTMLLLGFGMWLLGIPLSFVIRNKPEQYGYLPDGEVSTNSASESGGREESVEIGFKEALKMRSFLYLNIAEFLRFMAFASVSLHVMPYLASTGMTRHRAGLVAAAITLFTIIGRFLFGWLGDVYSKRIVMTWTCWLMSMGMLAFCFIKTGWMVFLFFLIFSPGLGGAMVLRAAILREYFGRDSFGKLIGILMGAGSIGGIIGPTLTGWIFDVQGSYYPAWLFYFFVMGLSSFLVLKIRQVITK